MKLFKILFILCISTASIFVFKPADASLHSFNTEMRVRTVPSSSEEKKKDTSKTNTVKQSSSSSSSAKSCNQKLLSSLYIGNGGKPK